MNGSSTVYIPFNTTYTELGANAIDDYDGDISSSVVISGNVNTQLLGTYTINYDISDSSGNSSSLSRTVIVRDVVKPVLTLLGTSPAVLEVHGTYTDAGAMAIDDYQGDISNLIQSSNNLNASVLGDYTYTYNVSDSSGNVADSIERTVSVVDTTKPVLSLIGDNPLQVELGDTYADPGVSVSDNYDSGLAASELINNIDMNTIGDYQIIFKSTDSSGNYETITRNVKVRDTTPPVLTVSPDEIVLQINSVASVDIMAGVNASDIQLSSLVASSGVSPSVEGTSVITYTATDFSGNVSTDTRTYKILDMPFMSMAKDFDSKFISRVGNSPRDFEAGEYGSVISNGQLYETYGNNFYSGYGGSTTQYDIQIIPYNDEIIGQNRNELFLIEENIGVKVVDISIPNGIGFPIHVKLPNLPGDYIVDKAVMSTKGLFFSVGTSIYFVPNDVTIQNSMFATLVVTLDPSVILASGVEWTATGKFVISHEIGISPTTTTVSLYNVENNNIKTTLAEEDFIFNGDDPQYNSRNYTEFHSNGAELFINFDNNIYVMNEAQIQTFDAIGNKNILPNSSDFNFVYKAYNYNFLGMFVLHNGLYNFAGNGTYVNQHSSMNNNSYNYRMYFDSAFGTKIHKLIQDSGNDYFTFYKDMAGVHKVGKMNVGQSVNNITMNTIRVYDTLSKQEVDLTGAFEAMFKYNNDMYLMPDETNPLFSISGEISSKLLRLKLP